MVQGRLASCLWRMGLSWKTITLQLSYARIWWLAGLHGGGMGAYVQVIGCVLIERDTSDFE
jgi:hypothetical protein